MKTVLRRIKVNQSLGPYQVHPWTMWNQAKKFAGVLAEMFVSSLVMGKVKEDWRMINVVLLFKKGLNKSRGCRQVSLRSVVVDRFLSH